jgi:hypothetical protein
VTPAGIVEGRGGGGAGVVVVGGGVVVVGGGVVVVGGGVVVVVGGGVVVVVGGGVVVVTVVVVPVSATADGDDASRTAESTPAAAHATSREIVSPRLTRGV